MNQETQKPAKNTTEPNKPAAQKNLGRGLSALFGEASPPPKKESPNLLNQGILNKANIAGKGMESNKPEMAGEGRRVLSLPIALIRPNKHQPRQIFTDDALDGLTESIQEKGVLQPILVRPHPDHKDNYQIIAGERRWRASQRAKLHEIPAIIMEAGESSTLEMALIENIHREALNSLEEAEAYQQLLSRYNYTQEQVAKAVGKSRSHIANLMRLLTLPEEIKAMLQDNHISMGHARALLGSKRPLVVAQLVVKKGLNVRQCEKLVQEERPEATINEKSGLNKHGEDKGVKKSTASPANMAASDPNVTSMMNELSDELGMQVTIHMEQNSEKGQISVAFSTLDQLDELINKLQGSEFL